MTIIFQLCLTLCCAWFCLFKQLKCLPSILLSFLLVTVCPKCSKSKTCTGILRWLGWKYICSPSPWQAGCVRLFIFFETRHVRWTTNAFTLVQKSLCNQLVWQTLHREQYFLRMTSTQLVTSFFLMQGVCNLWSFGCVWPATETYLSCSWLLGALIRIGTA